MATSILAAVRRPQVHGDYMRVRIERCRRGEAAQITLFWAKIALAEFVGSDAAVADVASIVSGWDEPSPGAVVDLLSGPAGGLGRFRLLNEP
jgi:hypothetical protein